VSEDQEMNRAYAQKVGEQLRAVRKRKRYSLQAVEASSTQEFKASVLGAYERGERAISVPRLQRLAAFYEVPVDQLLPRDDTTPGWAQNQSVIDLRNAGKDVFPRSNPEDRVTIDLVRLEQISTPEQDILARYVGMIRAQRREFSGKIITIRAEDIRNLAVLLDTTPENVRRRMNELGLSLRS
jgi:transcriptional regulator with XRE-family HTH domain